MSIKFRALRADEVDCKVKMVKSNGVMILLYKDARVDQRLLDEVVGPENWTRSHEVINGNLYCNVGIRVNREGFGEWVFKQDVGTESQTEAEKGQASDAFKRACFNWGLGRELYTAPFIWIPADKCNISQGNKCYDKFVCTHMEVVDGTITALAIANQNRNMQEVFRYGNSPAPQRGDTREDAIKNQELQNLGETEKIDQVKISTITKEISKKGLTANSILQHYKLTAFDQMTLNQWSNAMHLLQQYPDRK